MLVAFTESVKEEFRDSLDRLRGFAMPESSWKVMGLFFGARDITGRQDPLNPNYLKRAGFSAARNIVIGGYLPFKIPTQNSMIGARYSPLFYDGESITNEINGERISAKDYSITMPADIQNLLPTASGAIGIMSFRGCALFDCNNPCEFCIVGPTEGKKPADGDSIVKELEKLESIGYNPNNIVINTGQLPQKGMDLQVMGGIVAKLKERFPNYPVAAEVGPFSFIGVDDIASYLGEKGLDRVDTFMMNVEMISDEARKQLCPGKPPLKTYLDIMSKLSGLGYQLTSVIQLNFYPELEKKENLASFLGEIYRIGKGRIVPEFLISRAVPGSRLDDPYWKALAEEMPNEKAQAMMVERFGQFVDRLEYLLDLPELKMLDPTRIKAGCVRCRMCNITSEVYKSTRRIGNPFENGGYISH